MFKNLTVYALPEACRFIGGLPLNVKLEALPFKPCGPTEPESWGFVNPHAHSIGMSEPLGDGRTVLCVRRQQRKVPSDTLRNKVDELAKAFEQETGRKAGAKRRRELKEEALLELLPQAFTKDTTALVLIDCRADRLVVESTSSGMLDGVLTTLVKAVPGFAPAPWNTMDNPASWMAKMLLDDHDEGAGAFYVGRSLELRSDDVSERRVAWKNANLDGDDVQRNLAGGARVARMALEFNARTEFTLTDTGQLKGITMDLAAMAQPDGYAEGWRTDAELVTAEIALLLTELEAELGGRVSHDEPNIPAEAPTAAVSDGNTDPLLSQAVALVIEHNKASITLIQRHLRIGYNRAARLLEALQAEGLVAPMASDGTRKVLAVAA